MSYTPSLTLDTDPHPTLSLYSAGNFAEVAPERLSPVAWSLLGPPVERANRELVDRLWPGATWHGGSHFTFVGYFACRPYHNLSAYCRIARDVPLIEGRDVAASYFEDAPLPVQWRRGRGRGRLRVTAIARMIREYVGLEQRATLLEGRVSELEHATRAALRSGSPLRLGEVVARARDELTAIWDVHYATTITLVPLRVLQREVGERLVDCWDEVEPWLNRPPELVWETLQEAAALGGELGPGEFLERAFYEVADDHEPWRTLSTRHAVDPSGGGGRRRADDLSDVVWDVHGRARLGLLPQITNVVVEVFALRETTKSLAMRALHIFRRLLPEVARVHGVTEEDWPYLTVEELAAGQGGPRTAELARLRRRECELAFESDPGDLLDFSAPPAGNGSRSLEPAVPAQAPRRGRGVSGGVVTGVVVTPATAQEESARPKVLVCESADADIQRALRSVAAVVTARGSVLSHISILAREYGIPAVVGFGDAAALQPGALIQVDGTAGTVDVVGT
jgi:phosphohistidine swiveling domain-containing protein